MLDNSGRSEQPSGQGGRCKHGRQRHTAAATSIKMVATPPAPKTTKAPKSPDGAKRGGKHLSTYTTAAALQGTEVNRVGSGAERSKAEANMLHAHSFDIQCGCLRRVVCLHPTRRVVHCSSSTVAS